MKNKQYPSFSQKVKKKDWTFQSNPRMSIIVKAQQLRLLVPSNEI